jgi:hypothetical protein
METVCGSGSTTVRKDPLLADETYGFFSELYTARGRVFHVELRKTF